MVAVFMAKLCALETILSAWPKAQSQALQILAVLKPGLNTQNELSVSRTPLGECLANASTHARLQAI